MKPVAQQVREAFALVAVGEQAPEVKDAIVLLTHKLSDKGAERLARLLK